MRVLAAVNSAVSSEWRIMDSQIREGLASLQWEQYYDDANEPSHDDDGWINYEDFISAFAIVDRRKMSRSSSFGWHLVKDALGPNLMTIQY